MVLLEFLCTFLEQRRRKIELAMKYNYVWYDTIHFCTVYCEPEVGEVYERPMNLLVSVLAS